MVEASGGLEEIHARLCALRHALARLGSVRGAWDAVGQLWVRDVVHGACGERVARAARALALRRTGAAPILRMASPVRVATAHASLEPGSYFGLVACVPATRLAQSAPELALPFVEAGFQPRVPLCARTFLRPVPYGVGLRRCMHGSCVPNPTRKSHTAAPAATFLAAGAWQISTKVAPGSPDRLTSCDHAPCTPSTTAHRAPSTCLCRRAVASHRGACSCHV
jgi:hypothetical protein